MNKLIKISIYTLYMSISIALFICILKEIGMIFVEIMLIIFYYLILYT